jgi:hypothetical protein
MGNAYTLLLWEYSLDGRGAGIEYEVFKGNLMDEYKIEETQLGELAKELLARYARSV